ncbi:rod shape-determining protein MreC [Formicincola oecophyllae]|uniref:Cell shape-determining protein MreC n=1 Tax=Formicincola oecophyllae TaxID=2558361 RepID=A0A4Y6U8Q9_9PROT|nr:rod shape-determining protein MreC [Formicincola oecophyllae]QDH13839.1 rod shape-determining protein MreC [Formicincola oecophyllae]
MSIIQGRHVVQGILLPLCLLGAVALMAAGQMVPAPINQLRIAVASRTAPVQRMIVWPVHAVRHWAETFSDFTQLEQQNRQLRLANMALQRENRFNAAMAAENARLKSLLHWRGQGADDLVAPSSWSTAQVVREEGGTYQHAVIVEADPGQAPWQVGSIMVDGMGLAGRVSAVQGPLGQVILVTDPASHIPVTLMESGGQAIMGGDGTAAPRLQFYSQTRLPREGEQVVTRHQVGLTGGVPVGHVHYAAPGHPQVVLDADLSHLNDVVLYAGPALAPLASPDGRTHSRRDVVPLAYKRPAGDNVLKNLQNVWPFSALAKPAPPSP